MALPPASCTLGGGPVEEINHRPEPVLVGPVHADVFPEEL